MFFFVEELLLIDAGGMMTLENYCLKFPMGMKQFYAKIINEY